MYIMNGKFIKPIALILIAAFSFQDILWANPEMFAGSKSPQCLQFPTNFQNGGTAACEWTMKAEFEKFVMARKAALRDFVYPVSYPKNGLQVTMAFDKRRLDGDIMTVECSAGERKYIAQIDLSKDDLPYTLEEMTSKPEYSLKDRNRIIRLLEDHNWFYKSYSYSEKEDLARRVLDGLRPDAPAKIKEMVIKELVRAKVLTDPAVIAGMLIDPSAIKSVMVMGSWCYNKEPADIDFAVVVEGLDDNYLLEGIPIENGADLFTASGTHVTRCDIKVLSKRLLDHKTEEKKESQLIEEAENWGHAIVIEGPDLFHERPSRKILFYVFKKFLLEAVVRLEHYKQGSPEEKGLSLRKIGRRLQEAAKIVRALVEKSPEKESIIRRFDAFDKDMQDFLSKEDIVGVEMTLVSIREYVKDSTLFQAFAAPRIAPPAIALANSGSGWVRHELTEDQHEIINLAMGELWDKGYELPAADDIVTDIAELLRPSGIQLPIRIHSPPDNIFYDKVYELANSYGVEFPLRNQFRLITHPGTYRDLQGQSRSFNLFIPQSELAFIIELNSRAPQNYRQWIEHEIAHLVDRANKTRGAEKK
jgi:hypothetical protein